jgi:hypothetical protein
MKKLIIVICVSTSLKCFSQTQYDLTYTFRTDREIIFPVLARWFNLSDNLECKFECTHDSTYYHLSRYAFAMAESWYMRLNPRYLEYLDSLPYSKKYIKEVCPCK